MEDGRCWSVMAMSVEFLMMLRMVCLKLFPSLICFNEYADRGWKGGCTSYIAFAFGLMGLNCAVTILTGHGTDSSVCINSYWLLV